MAPYDVLERADNVRSTVQGHKRISVTELSRGKDWRSQLPEAGVIEVTDRGDTTAWLVSDADMQALVEGYRYLEEELERMQIAALFEARATDKPATNSKLKKEALASFDRRKDALREIINGR